MRIFTYDWERALAFYRDTAGFEVTFANPGFGWAQLRAGGAFIGLERCSLDDPESEDLVGRFVGASLEVDDIHATYQALANNGVEFVSPPKAQDWGGILAHFKDPDGNVLPLLNKVTP